MQSQHEERYKQIRRAIKHYRLKCGLSQEALATKIGISVSYIGKIEAPKSSRSLSLDILLSIADGLNIDIRDLLTPIEEKREELYSEDP